MNLDLPIFAQLKINDQLASNHPKLQGSESMTLRQMIVYFASALSESQVQSRSFDSLHLSVSRKPIPQNFTAFAPPSESEQILKLLEISNALSPNLDSVPIPDLPGITAMELIQQRADGLFRSVEETARKGGIHPNEIKFSHPKWRNYFVHLRAVFKLTES